MKTQTFALFFGNRGFMPEELAISARKEMIEAVTRAGYSYIAMDPTLTRNGSVETRDEGRLYHKWLKENEGKYDGVILCMPNFSDENGAVEALKDANRPILIQAYPDEIGKMDFANRRDAFCGKFSIEDVFYQYHLPFTVLKPHVVHPLSDTFTQNLHDFAGVCRVVNGMKRFTIGAIGARTSKFKTVRYDEITLQKYGITVEVLDLSELFYRVQKFDKSSQLLKDRIERFTNYTNCSHVPSDKLETIAITSLVIDQIIDEYHLDCVTLRCWEEMQAVLGIAPCVILSELNDRGFPASCEIDLCSAISMHALNLATQSPSACLDWNNNYGDEENKVILFHCGPVPQKLMVEKGTVTDHKMFAKGNPGCGWGSNEGRIKSFEMTYTNCRTEDGKLIMYVDEGKFTEDKIEKAFFGCGGVAEIDSLQDKLISLGRNGFKHHTAVGVGRVKHILDEAFNTYLNYTMVDINK